MKRSSLGPGGPLLSIGDNLPWKVFRRPCYPSMPRSEEKFSHWKRSCNSGKYVFRPRLSATPSDHAFRPRLSATSPDVPFESRTSCFWQNWLYLYARRCAALSAPIVLSLADDGKDNECDGTQLLSCDNLDWGGACETGQNSSCPNCSTRFRYRNSEGGPQHLRHVRHGRITIPVHKSHDE